MTENPTPDDCRRMSTMLAHAFNDGGKTDSPQEVKDAIEMLAWAGAKIERLEAAVRYANGEPVHGAKDFEALCGLTGGPKYSWRKEMLRLAGMN